MDESITNRIKSNKEKFLEYLRSVPIVQIAAERSAVSRSTFYRWKKEDEEFAYAAEKAIREGHGLINDLAESQLISNIKNGNMTGIIFWLKYHHSDYSERGYLGSSEIETISRLLVKESTTKDEYELLARFILERKISPHIARILIWFLTKVMRQGKGVENPEQSKLLETIISKVNSD